MYKRLNLEKGNSFKRAIFRCGFEILKRTSVAREPFAEYDPC